MGDMGFVIPAAHAGRYARPTGPVGPGGTATVDATQPRAMEYGGGCAVSTAADYLRFAQMLLDGGALDGTRVLGRKTVEFMTSDQLPRDIDLTRLDEYPNLNGGYGFGLSVAVRRAGGVAGIMGSAGDYHWGGGAGTYFWVNPEEELAVVFMPRLQAPRVSGTGS